MEIEEQLGGLLGGLSNFGSSVYEILVYLVIALIVGGLGYYIYFLSSHKIKVRIRTITGGKDIVIDDKARVIKNNGVIKWRLLRLKEEIIPAPPEAISIDNKGNPVVECYYTSDNNFEFIDATTPKVMQGDKYKESFDPLTTRQRGIAVSQTIKALTRKKTNWKEHIIAIAGLGACVIIVVCMFVFWENITKPNLEMADKLTGNLDKFITITEKQAEITYRQEAIMKEWGIRLEKFYKIGEAPD